MENQQEPNSFTEEAESVLNKCSTSQREFFYELDDNKKEALNNVLGILTQHQLIEVADGTLKDSNYWLPFLKFLCEKDDKIQEFSKIVKLFNEKYIIKENDSSNDLNLLRSIKLDKYDELSGKLLNEALAIYYSIKPTIEETTIGETILANQIPGWTLLNEYIAKRTKYYPRNWINAMQHALNEPSDSNYFELYKLYFQRKDWLDSIWFSPLKTFLTWLYSTPIDSKFANERLTIACDCLQKKQLLNQSNFNFVSSCTDKERMIISILETNTLLDETNLSILNRLTSAERKLISDSPQNFISFLRAQKEVTEEVISLFKPERSQATVNAIGSALDLLSQANKIKFLLAELTEQDESLMVDIIKSGKQTDEKELFLKLILGLVADEGKAQITQFCSIVKEIGDLNLKEYLGYFEDNLEDLKIILKEVAGFDYTKFSDPKPSIENKQLLFFMFLSEGMQLGFDYDKLISVYSDEARYLQSVRKKLFVTLLKTLTTDNKENIRKIVEILFLGEKTLAKKIKDLPLCTRQFFMKGIPVNSNLI